MTTNNYSFNLEAVLNTAAGTIAVGTVCIDVEGTDTYITADTANRGTRRAHGIARTSGVAGEAIIIQSSGYCPNSVTGVGAGTKSWCITSTTGTIQRKPTPSASDDLLGWCDAAGGVLLACGGGGGSAPGSPTGTGIPHVVSDVMNDAASLIVNADVSASAAIAASKVVQATGTGFPHVTGGVLDAASVAVNLATAHVTGILPTANQASQVGGSNTHVQYNNSSAFGGNSGFTYDGTNVVTTGYLGVGAATRAAAGDIRMNSTGSIYVWTGAASMQLLAASGGTSVRLGDSISTDHYHFATNGSNYYQYLGGLLATSTSAATHRIGTPASAWTSTAFTIDGDANAVSTSGIVSVATTDATQTTAVTIAIANNCTYAIDAIVSCSHGSNTKRARYKVSAAVYGASGAATIIGSVQQDEISNDTNMDATLTVSGGNALIRVTGVAATTLRWAVEWHALKSIA